MKHEMKFDTPIETLGELLVILEQFQRTYPDPMEKPRTITFTVTFRGKLKSIIVEDQK